MSTHFALLALLALLLSACSLKPSVQVAGNARPSLEPGQGLLEGWINTQMDCTRGPPGSNACGGPLLIVPFSDQTSPVLVGGVTCAGGDAHLSPTPHEDVRVANTPICTAPDGSSYPVATAVFVVIQPDTNEWINWSVATPQ